MKKGGHGTAQRGAGRALPAAEAFASFRAMVERSWRGYPDAALREAWLNATLADHGIGEEQKWTRRCPPW